MTLRPDSLLGVIVADLPRVLRSSRRRAAYAVVVAVAFGAALAWAATPVTVAISGQDALAGTMLGSYATVGALVGLGFVAAPLAGLASLTYVALEAGTIDHAGPTGRVYGSVVELLALLLVSVVVPLTARAIATLYVGRRGRIERLRAPAIVLATCALGWFTAIAWTAALPSILRSALLGPGRYEDVLFVRPEGGGAMFAWVAAGLVVRRLLVLPQRTAAPAGETTPVPSRRGATIVRAAGGAVILTMLLGGLLTWPETAVVAVLLAAVRLTRQGALPATLARLGDGGRRWDMFVYASIFAGGMVGVLLIDDSTSSSQLRGLGWLTVGLIALLVLIARNETATAAT